MEAFYLATVPASASDSYFCRALCEYFLDKSPFFSLLQAEEKESDSVKLVSNLLLVTFVILVDLNEYGLMVYNGGLIVSARE